MMRNQPYSHQQIIIDYAMVCAIFRAINVALWAVNESLQQRHQNGLRKGSSSIHCRRRTLCEMKNLYGALFSRAYRMKYEAFTHLYCLLENGMKAYLEQNDDLSSFYVHSGPIDGEVYLLIALCYFTGGSYLDIMISHGVAKTDFYQSLWCVVHAVNTCPQLQLMFLESQGDCEELATEFIGQLQAGFNNCVGCIDGILLWMEKPSKQQCAEAGVDSGKFYCGRKGKYGLNLQAVCDACHRFIDVSAAPSICIRLPVICDIFSVSMIT